MTLQYSQVRLVQNRKKELRTTGGVKLRNELHKNRLELKNRKQKKRVKTHIFALKFLAYSRALTIWFRQTIFLNKTLINSVIQMHSIPFYYLKFAFPRCSRQNEMISLICVCHRIIFTAAFITRFYKLYSGNLIDTSTAKKRYSTICEIKIFQLPIKADRMWQWKMLPILRCIK